MKPFQNPNLPLPEVRDLTTLFELAEDQPPSFIYDRIADSLAREPGRWFVIRSADDPRPGTRASALKAATQALEHRVPRLEITSAQRPTQPWRVFARQLSENASGAERRKRPLPPPMKLRRSPEQKWHDLGAELRDVRPDWRPVTERRPLPARSSALTTPRRNFDRLDGAYEVRIAKDAGEWWVEARCAAATIAEELALLKADAERRIPELEAKVRELRAELAECREVAGIPDPQESPSHSG